MLQQNNAETEVIALPFQAYRGHASRQSLKPMLMAAYYTLVQDDRPTLHGVIAIRWAFKTTSLGKENLIVPPPVSVNSSIQQKLRWSCVPVHPKNLWPALRNVPGMSFSTVMRTSTATRVT